MLIYSPLQRFQARKNKREEGEQRKGNLCQMPQPGISETGGFPNLTCHQKEVQSHMLLIFSSQNKFSRNINAKPGHKSSAKFSTFHQAEC